MFATASLAKRIERAEKGLIVEAAQASAARLPAGQIMIEEFNGAAAVYVAPGAPFNKVAAAGFDGVPSAEVLDRLEQAYAARQSPVQFEVSSLADPAVVRLLTTRGYELVGFENVLGREIGRRPLSAPDDIRVTRAGLDESEAWLDAVVTGFLHPDVFDGPPSHESISREVMERIFRDMVAAPSFERYVARRGGAVAGAASFRIDGGVAQLNGAATLPAHRRRGVQTALLAHRLNEAEARGCDVAVVTTQPGSKSQENVQRAGFSLLYTRAILVKSPPV
jgi:ribosomal protein S18 acetylase RimI-like enzyme